MDKQLAYLVKQTERYTRLLAVNLLSGGMQGSTIRRGGNVSQSTLSLENDDTQGNT